MNIFRHLFSRKIKSRFSKKLNMEMELVSCKLCGSDVHHEFQVVENTGFMTQYVVCDECGLNFMNPMYTQAAYNRYYDGIYEKHHGVKQAGDIEPDCKGDKVGKYFKKALPDLKKVYEIGCGAGGNLLAFQKFHGYSVGGLDPSNAARDIAKEKFGIDIDLSDCESITKAKLKGFEAVCMLDVIEHLVDPVSSLKHLFKVMETGSHLYVETLALEVDYPPKGLSGYFRIPHPYNFTIKTLEGIIKSAGFNIVETVVLGRGMVSVLATRENRPVECPESEIKNKASFDLTMDSLIKKEIDYKFYKIRSFPFKLAYMFLYVVLVRMLKKPQFFENNAICKYIRNEQAYY